MTSLLDEVRISATLPDPDNAMDIRRRAHVSRERLAAELNVHAITIARWERGTRTPRGELRVRYAKLLRLLNEIMSSP